MCIFVLLSTSVAHVNFVFKYDVAWTHSERTATIIKGQIKRVCEALAKARGASAFVGDSGSNESVSVVKNVLLKKMVKNTKYSIVRLHTRTHAYECCFCVISIFPPLCSSAPVGHC